jgi:hypothetical protein
MLRLEFNKSLVSVNKLLRSHWGVRHRLKEEWRELIGKQLLLSGNKAKEYLICEPSKRRVKITVYKKGKLFDVDNLYAACKVIIDAMKCKTDECGMKSYGLIYDDSETYLNLEIEQIKSKENRIIIEIAK